VNTSIEACVDQGLDDETLAAIDFGDCCLFDTSTANVRIESMWSSSSNPTSSASSNQTLKRQLSEA
jgi:hypothetical protein